MISKEKNNQTLWAGEKAPPPGSRPDSQASGRPSTHRARRRSGGSRRSTSDRWGSRRYASHRSVKNSVGHWNARSRRRKGEWKSSRRSASARRRKRRELEKRMHSPLRAPSTAKACLAFWHVDWKTIGFLHWQLCIELFFVASLLMVLITAYSILLLVALLTKS